MAHGATCNQQRREAKQARLVLIRLGILTLALAYAAEFIIAILDWFAQSAHTIGSAGTFIFGGAVALIAFRFGMRRINAFIASLNPGRKSWKVR